MQGRKPERDQRIMEMLASGVPVRDVAAEFGLTEPRIYQIINRENEPRRVAVPTPLRPLDPRDIPRGYATVSGLYSLCGHRVYATPGIMQSFLRRHRVPFRTIGEGGETVYVFHIIETERLVRSLVRERKVG